MRHRPEPFGLLAEFDDAPALVSAAKGVREAGYTRLDAYSPFPLEGLARAIGFREILLPFIALAGGALGGIGGYLMQWWLNALDYPINVGGRPLDAWPAFAVSSFALMVLGAVLAVLIGMLALNCLPRLYHPVFNAARFERVAVDRFFLLIERDDPYFHEERTPALLEGLGAVAVEEGAVVTQVLTPLPALPRKGERCSLPRQQLVPSPSMGESLPSGADPRGQGGGGSR